MSYPLWQYLFDDDVEGFRNYLARATYDRNASRTVGGVHSSSFKIGSPGHLGTSPKTPVKSRKSGGIVSHSNKNVVLSRSDVNARDGFGRTLLHHAVTLRSESATVFVKLLLEIPVLDLYVQDTESGWTALHRALYCGNIASAQALMIKDIHNATDYTRNISHVNAGGLVKIKDHEGNSPFEVFSLTTAPRDIREITSLTIDGGDAQSEHSIDMDEVTSGRTREISRSLVDLSGNEVFAFGSNKNITLGLGDGDDRSFPERIQLVRPKYLLGRLLADFKAERKQASVYDESVDGLAEMTELPTVIKNKPVRIMDVAMSKLHTAILTKDPLANLHICGFGPGGRLGMGDEATRFTFSCVDGGGLGKRRVTYVALGQDHSIVVCASGEVFTWGSNKYGQLGYELPEVSSNETPTQLVPRQVYGLIKKEHFIGAAASALHSVIYTSSGLYTFGKNEGQLGLMDADARSLEIQTLPRRVGVSVLQSSIEKIVAIDRATTVLLENHDVIVFTHYGWTKVIFPLDSFGSSIASDAFFVRHKRQTKHISQITAAGNTIAALSSYGEVFAIDVPRHVDSVPSNKSTTNPSKARNALPIPSKIWSIRKSHMAARDVAIGQDGSIILCTTAGTVWKKEKRAKIKIRDVQSGNVKTKDYKFVRVNNVFGAVAVRSNAYGAFMAVRQDFDVMRDQIVVGPSTMTQDLFNLLPFHDYGFGIEDENTKEPQLRFWKPATKGPCPALVKRALLTRSNREEELQQIVQRYQPLSSSEYDVWITSDAINICLPVHSLLLKSRSHILRRALATFSESYYSAISDILSIEYDSDGQIKLKFHGAQFLTLVNFVLYLYTDNLADVWRFTSHALHLAQSYRSVRTELMRVATALEMKHLERAVRVIDDPVPCLRDDMDLAFHDSDLFSDANVVIDLADGEERYAHSVILQARCPFFEGLFQGHTGGMWLADRRQNNQELEAVRVDLKHISADIFELVLRHVYADTGSELFDTITTDEVDEFLDIVIDTMAAANELMLERLARVCQNVIGQFVTPRNICGLLNTIAESSEESFKVAGLEYIGLNLEYMLEQNLLEELDDVLLEELNEMVQDNQMSFMPISRSDIAIETLLEKDPTLSERLEEHRQRRLDAMRLPSRYIAESVKPRTVARSNSEAAEGKSGRSFSGLPSPTPSPVINANRNDDLPFDMDDEILPRSSLADTSTGSPLLRTDQNLSKRPSLSALSSSRQSQYDDDIGQSAYNIPSALTAAETSHNKSSKALPWAAQASPTPGLGLKDIMFQDSSIKVSNLTQSLQNAAAAAAKQTPVKISQKERKRQQQEQRLQHEKFIEVSVGKEAKSVSGPSSPWAKVNAKTAMPAVSPKAATESPTIERQQSATVEGPSRSSEVDDKRKDKQPQPSRSVSSPGMTGVSKGPPPQIQSIRHTPTPARSSSWIDARTSMADILAQQHYEKLAITDHASKRSLEEIQQEQEFQEWWDLEARKVQEEEEQAAVIPKRGKSAIRGGKKRGSSQHVEQATSAVQKSDPFKGASDIPQSGKNSSQRGKQNKSRGSYRGRGRGAAQGS